MGLPWARQCGIYLRFCFLLVWLLHRQTRFSPLKLSLVDSFSILLLPHSFIPCLSCSLLSEGSVMYASICVDYLSFPTTIPHSLVVTQT